MPEVSNSNTFDFQRGLYNPEYFSGSQVAVFVGDVWIDEITSLSFQVEHKKMPLYGYNDKYFRAVSKGQVLVQGQFTINFKEAGYIWLALNEYRKRKGQVNYLNPFIDSDDQVRLNVERIANNNPENDPAFIKKRNEAVQTMANFWSVENTALSLQGYPGGGRTASNEGSLGAAENIFENFEDAIWNKQSQAQLGKNFPKVDELSRDAADPFLNGFDIYISYGDFIGDNRLNHTIRKISNIHIFSWGQQIVSENGALQEVYGFLARSAV